MAAHPLRVLSLCSGVGALDLALRVGLGDSARTVCYVEREAYAAACLVARMADGWLDDAPVWDDLLTFDGRRWRGAVDCVVAGFPCQPASHAGQRKGTDDDRWLWPVIAGILADVAPAAVLLENVPGLLTVNDGDGYGDVLGSLAALGFDATWGCVSAADAGAPHLRERVWVLALAHDHPAGRGSARLRADGDAPRGNDPDGCGATLADADERGRRHGPGFVGGQRPAQRDTSVGDTDDTGRQGRVQAVGGGRDQFAPWPPGPADADGWRAVLAVRPDLAPALEPEIRRVADGVAAGMGVSRTDALRAIGNGVDIGAAALAVRRLASMSGHTEAAS